MGGMTALESPRPRRRAFWVDARFAVGLLLVVASVVGVWFVISAARQTVSVFAAAHTTVPGQVPAGDVVPQNAVGPAAASRTTSVVVHSAVDVPAVVDAGSVLGVWGSAMQER